MKGRGKALFPPFFSPNEKCSSDQVFIKFNAQSRLIAQLDMAIVDHRLVVAQHVRVSVGALSVLIRASAEKNLMGLEFTHGGALVSLSCWKRGELR